ncbi:hypothetical protein ACZ11_05095 [Lysinibacillus xylanilyticus]|uniref:Uncharacterized protein n=1 Tax=Lysinibacillus xylanilyticus TaxID=582475 RepID=A0A0K9FAX8_9BACI|nr:hypothetical protein ACZ11_05095 [Lysinibacillus xylanilyticus]
MGISDRGTKAKTITSCDNAFVTNIVLARDPGASSAFLAAHRTPLGKRPVGTEINPYVITIIQNEKTLDNVLNYEIIEVYFHLLKACKLYRRAACYE